MYLYETIYLCFGVLPSDNALLFLPTGDVLADSSNTMEIDFLITAGYDDAAGRMRVSPVEVKSTKRYGAKSLEKFKAKLGKRVGARYVLHPRPMEVDGDLIRLPLYMAHLL